MKYRVLLTMTHTGIGGVTEHVLALARSLDPNLFEVTVASAPGGPYEKEFIQSGIPFVAIPSYVRHLHPVHDARAILSLVRLLKKERFDIVHAHGPKAGFLARLAARLCSVPVVMYTHHGIVFHSRQSAIKRYVYRNLEALATTWTHKLVCVSEYNRDTLLRAGIGRRDDYVVVWNGVDPSPYQLQEPESLLINQVRTSLNIAPTDIVIAMVARLEEPKDPVLLVRAAAHIDSGIPWKILFVGDGSLRPHVERVARELRIESKVVITGFRSDVPAVLAASDIAVLASKSEGLPISVIEAMMAGKPVVATSVGGTREVVVDNETGFLVPVDDPISLGNRLSILAAHADLRSHMGALGRSRALELFSWDRMSQQISTLYLDQLRTHGVAH